MSAYRELPFVILSMGIHWDKGHNTRLNLYFLRLNFVGVISSRIFGRICALPPRLRDFHQASLCLDQSPKTFELGFGHEEVLQWRTVRCARSRVAQIEHK